MRPRARSRPVSREQGDEQEHSLPAPSGATFTSPPTQVTPSARATDKVLGVDEVRGIWRWCRDTRQPRWRLSWSISSKTERNKQGSDKSRHRLPIAVVMKWATPARSNLLQSNYTLNPIIRSDFPSCQFRNRVAAAIFVAPAKRKRLTAVLRKAAISCGRWSLRI